MPMQEPDPFTEAIKRAEQRLIARYHNLYEQVQTASSIKELDEIGQHLYEQIRARKIEGTVRALRGFYEGRLIELCTEMIYVVFTHSPTLQRQHPSVILESKNHHIAISQLRSRFERHLADLQGAEPDEPIFVNMALWYQRYQRWILWWQVVDRLGWEQAHPEGDQWERRPMGRGSSSGRPGGRG